MKISYLFYLFLFVGISLAVSNEAVLQYLQVRQNLISKEEDLSFSAATPLSDEEQYVNEILRDFVTYDTANLPIFPSTDNFRFVKDEIDRNSLLLPMIKTMPKGGLLHVHAIGNPEFIFDGTYRLDCWMNVGADTSLIPHGGFYFSPTIPPSINGTKWVNVMESRRASGNITDFDAKLFSTLQFFTPNASIAEDDMWVYFDSTIGRISSLVAYWPVFRAAMLSGMQALVNDGIQVLELRGFDALTYDENGLLSDTEIVERWIQVVEEFNSVSPVPLMVKFICSYDRRDSPFSIWEDLLQTVNLREQFPEYIVGFDLVDEEDRFNTLLYYLEDFMNIRNYTDSNGLEPLRYFFHAGETDWNSRYNLFDAILLNTSRIGHGFALKDYPLLMEMVKAQGIAIEVSPISNQMLRLVDDLRLHPAVVLLNNNVSISISSDDPTIYGYEGVTYDYYVAMMSWNLDLAGLKQLSMNGILYSALTPSEKQQTMKLWQQQWDLWIDSVLSNFIPQN